MIYLKYLFNIVLLIFFCSYCNNSDKYLKTYENSILNNSDFHVPSKGIQIITFFEPFDCIICIDEINDISLEFSDLKISTYTTYPNPSIVEQFSKQNNGFYYPHIIQNAPFLMEGTPLSLIFKDKKLVFVYYSQQDWKKNKILHNKIVQLLNE